MEWDNVGGTMKFDFSNFKFDPLNVIETVNSIMGERDTTKETQKKLDDLDYPHIKDLLPFEDYDSSSQLFINKGSRYSTAGYHGQYPSNY